MDPADAEAAEVLPPVLAELARLRDGADTPRWLGNLYVPRNAST